MTNSWCAGCVRYVSRSFSVRKVTTNACVNPSDFFSTLMKWADEVRTVGVRTNADTPEDSRVARKFGAEGIGLCRTEHMFFGTPDEAKGKPAGYVPRINFVRQMVLAAGTFKRLEKKSTCISSIHTQPSPSNQTRLGERGET